MSSSRRPRSAYRGALLSAPACWPGSLLRFRRRYVDGTGGDTQNCRPEPPHLLAALCQEQRTRRNRSVGGVRGDDVRHALDDHLALREKTTDATQNGLANSKGDNCVAGG